MQKLLTFFSKSISIYAILVDQRFNDTLTNDIVSFGQMGPRELLDGIANCINLKLLLQFDPGTNVYTVCTLELIQ